jgi:Nickel responsive protein SCO4226-like
MGKYLVVHPVGPDMNVEQAGPIGKVVKANCTPDAYWVRSWYTPEDGKFYCEWDAKDADAVREALTRAAAAGAQMPVEGVYAIGASLNGEDFR